MPIADCAPPGEFLVLSGRVAGSFPHVVLIKSHVVLNQSKSPAFWTTKSCLAVFRLLGPQDLKARYGASWALVTGGLAETTTWRKCRCGRQAEVGAHSG